MELLPANLIDAKGNTVPKGDVLGGVLGLYFSAHWCPPCRGFTPVLSKWYSSFVAANPDKKLHLVFVSSDRTVEDFNEYHGTMGFHALPFAERDIKAKLSAAFGVRGIPTLVLLGKDGELLTKDGRTIVTEDPTAQGYPWPAKTLAEEVAGPLLCHTGGADEASLQGKYVSYYFSAHWCGPCRAFTPVLTAAYNAAKAAGKQWEIVFVSADQSEEEFNEYFETMPWLALPHEDPRAAMLNARFEVEGIPTLVLVSPDGKVLTTELRGAIDEDPTAADFPWPRKAVTSLRAAVGSINEVPTLVVLTDGSPAQEAAARAALGPAADAELARGDDTRLRFAVSGNAAEDIAIRDKLLALTGHADAALPCTVLFAVPHGKRHDLTADQLTVDGIMAVVEAFGEGTLPLIDLR